MSRLRGRPRPSDGDRGLRQACQLAAALPDVVHHQSLRRASPRPSRTKWGRQPRADARTTPWIRLCTGVFRLPTRSKVATELEKGENDYRIARKANQQLLANHEHIQLARQILAHADASKW